MRSLIIGAGSIGLRHAEVLKNIGIECDFLTRRNDIPYQTFKKLDEVHLEIMHISLLQMKHQNIMILF